MAPIGRGIFVKAKLLSEELTVDVGDKKFIKKNIPETKRLLEDQLKKLNSIKIDLENELNGINEELTEVMLNAQPQHIPNKENEHNHKNLPKSD